MCKKNLRVNNKESSWKKDLEPQYDVDKIIQLNQISNTYLSQIDSNSASKRFPNINNNLQTVQK